MQFGPVPVSDSAGHVLAHSVQAGDLRLRKGHRLTTDDAEALAREGLTEITVAQIGPEDVDENTAAARLAGALGDHGFDRTAPFTGRVNLTAPGPGIVRLDAEAIHALNAVDEAVTLATLPDAARLDKGQLVATIKIIPYAVPEVALEAAIATLGAAPLRFHPFQLRRASLILTKTPGLKPSLLAKARQVTEARLTALGMTLAEVIEAPHDTASVADALRRAPGEMILIMGGSATSDRADVVPSAIEAAGGAVDRYGMPVDPGNLLILGQLAGRPVVGLPGCARSPALNGADWVLERLAAKLAVTNADIARMGVGGLLKEIPQRPQPRRGGAKGRRVELLLLAAGASRRMRGQDKLLRDVDGAPMLRRAAEAALASRADAVRVVLPSGADARRAALEGLAVPVSEAADASSGMAASLRAGLRDVAEGTAAVVVALADMPDVTAEHFDRVIAAFEPEEGREIAQAETEDGVIGHPVLFGQRFFESLAALTGDRGARDVIAANRDFHVTVPTPGQGAACDLDTPEAWDAWHAARQRD